MYEDDSALGEDLIQGAPEDPGSESPVWAAEEKTEGGPERHHDPEQDPEQGTDFAHPSLDRRQGAGKMHPRAEAGLGKDEGEEASGLYISN